MPAREVTMRRAPTSLALLLFSAVSLAATPAVASHLMTRGWLLPEPQVAAGEVVAVLSPSASAPGREPDPGELLPMYGRLDPQGDLLSWLTLRPGEWSQQRFGNEDNEVALLQDATPQGLLTLRIVFDGETLPDLRLSVPVASGRAFFLVGAPSGRTVLVGVTRRDGFGD